MNLYFEMAGDRSAGTREQQRGAFHLEYLGDEGPKDKSVVFAVAADGVEGRPGGQVAANLVTTTFRRAVSGEIGTASFPKVLRDGITAANQALRDAIEETPQLEGMACSVAGLLLVAGRLHWASVGDAVLFLVRRGQLRRLNADHRYGALLEKAQAEGVDLEPEEGLTPDTLISAVTGDDIAEIDCPNQGVNLEEGDRIILASRALLDVGTTMIRPVARTASEPRFAVTALAKAVEGSGERPDGATVIVFDVHDRDPKPVEEEAVAEATAPRTGSLLLNVVTGVAAVVLFVSSGLGAWYGLGKLEAWRDAVQSSAVSSRPAAVTRAPSVPSPQTTQGGAPPSLPPPGGLGGGLTFGAPPGGQGGGLTFGAPAPLPAIAGTSGSGAAPAAPVDGVRHPLADGGEGPLMVSLPGGEFQMGSASQAGSAQSRPQREVTVEPFAISAHEVTMAQYRRFAEATGRKVYEIPTVDPETFPVSRVTWEDAYAFTIWLSKQTGKRYRLPSEAQWEYAARGGTATAFWWGNQAGAGEAHCFGCDTGLNPRQPTRVGRFDPNPFGLYDTAGNVAEWIHDCWHPNYRDAPSHGGVWEGGDCTHRVTRGGGFSAPAPAMRSAARRKVPSDRVDDALGFRVVLLP